MSSGLKLGMTLKKYKEVVGSDIELEGLFYQKAFERRESMTETERTKLIKSYPGLPDNLYWDIVIFIRGAFRSGILDVLQVSKTQTN